MTATLLSPSPALAAQLLRESPVSDLRQLDVMESDSEIVISGTVASYYLKQMAQETVRPALAGRRLRNTIIVLAMK
ncbi:MAG TPA: BON domain-containing protein [Gemmataceae bacterium]|nr:BON domain-containing protein [Gemmataceae bacterium]